MKKKKSERPTHLLVTPKFHYGQRVLWNPRLKGFKPQPGFIYAIRTKYLGVENFEETFYRIQLDYYFPTKPIYKAMSNIWAAEQNLTEETSDED